MAEPFANESTAVRTGPVDSIKQSELTANLQLQAKRDTIRKEINNPNLSNEEVDRILYIREHPQQQPQLSQGSEERTQRLQQQERIRQQAVKANQQINNYILRSTPTMSDEFAYKHPEAIQQAVKANSTYLPTALVSAVAFPAAKAVLSIPEVRGALNLGFGIQGASNLTGENGINKTLRKFGAGRYLEGAASLSGDILDAAMMAPAIKTAYSVGRNTENAINTAVNNYFYQNPILKLNYQRVPELIQHSNNRLLNANKIKGLLNTPTSTRINYGSIITLPSSSDVFYLDSPEANLNFIRKFNKWNRRYGYPMLNKNLANDGNALNDAIKERLKQHNTFYRGVFIDTQSNPQKYQELQNQMRIQGIEPTEDNILEFLATHYLPETGHGGRSGFGNIPYVQQHRYNTEDVGAIYTSNSLEQAVGYANRNGRRAWRGVFKVQRPISFEGSREDWVLNGDFPLFNGSSKSNTYYQYELPYLMTTGKAVPKSITIDWDKYNRNLRFKTKSSSFNREDYDHILEIYKAQERTPHLISFGVGTPFLDFRISELRSLLNRLYSREGSRAFHDKYSQAFDDGSRMPFEFSSGLPLPPSEYRIKQYQAIYPREVLDKFETIANSRNYRNSQYRKFKESFDNLKSSLRRQATSYTTDQDIKDFVTEAGITQNKPILNIGTSESLRTSTINSDPRKAFQHVIFAGRPWEQGLEVVERVPYSQWKTIEGTTAHKGKWTSGVSRKSKKFGGKLRYEKD